MLCDNILPNLNISRLVIDRLYNRLYAHQNRCPPWGIPPIKNEVPPSEKQPSLPLKREAPFHEMIPRKITININLKSSSNPWKVCLKKFIFRLAGLQVYSGQLYYQMNSFTGIFRQHFKPHMLPMYWLKLPPQSNFEEPTPVLFR